MVPRSAQDAINASVYHAPEIIDHYPAQGLDVAESVAAVKHYSAIVGRDVFDIGVGTGRTTKVLARVTKRYVGIDYSEPMVSYVRARFKDCEIRHADMRQLGQWEAQSFDCVFASNNVIDAVGHEDRLQVLREVRRILRPNGIFAFSSHNRAVQRDVAKTHPVLQRSRNPFTQLSYLRHYLRQKKNAERLRPHYESNNEYAIQTDIGHDFSVLHYYINCRDQIRQLESLGFSVMDVISREGRLLTGSDLGEDSNSLFYVARKTG